MLPGKHAVWSQSYQDFSWQVAAGSGTFGGAAAAGMAAAGPGWAVGAAVGAGGLAELFPWGLGGVSAESAVTRTVLEAGTVTGPAVGGDTAAVGPGGGGGSGRWTEQLFNSTTFSRVSVMA